MTSPKDRTILALVSLVGVFIVGSMTMLIVAAFMGAGGTGQGKIWAGLFSLTTAILGAIAGWLGGSASAARDPNPHLEVEGGETDGNVG